MNFTKQQLKDILFALKEFAPDERDQDNLAEDVAFSAGMIQMMNVLGFEVWNQGGRWSLRKKDNGVLLIDNDAIIFDRCKG